MIGGILKALLPVIAFVINVVVQILTVRYVKKFGLLKSIFFGFGIGFFSIVAVHFYLYNGYPQPFQEFFSTLVVDIIVFSSLGYGYFHFINLGETARRIRLLIELKNAKNGFTLDEFLMQYNAKEMVEKRLSRLLSTGQVKSDGTKYYLGKPLVLMMAKMMVAMKIFVLGRRSEFS